MSTITTEEKCPRCGCEDIAYEGTEYTWEGYIQYVTCPECGATGSALYKFENYYWED